MLQNRIYPEACGRRANIVSLLISIGIFNRQNRLSGRKEGGKLVAPTFSEAAFGGRPIEDLGERFRLLGVVLQADAEAALVGFRCQPTIEGELIHRCEGETGGIGVSVEVIRGSTPSKPFAAQRSSRGVQDGGEGVDLADIQPAFPRPTRIICADHLGGEVILIRPPIFPGAGVEVADHFCTPGVQIPDLGLRGLEEVQVEDVRLDRRN